MGFNYRFELVESDAPIGIAVSRLEQGVEQGFDIVWRKAELVFIQTGVEDRAQFIAANQTVTIVIVQLKNEVEPHGRVSCNE
jgi:hypothetical protein